MEIELFRHDLNELHREAMKCHNCPLWANATHTVLGAGNRHAEIMLIGEQRGGQKDIQGL